MPLVAGMTVTVKHKPPSSDGISYTWLFQAKFSPGPYDLNFYINQYPTCNCQLTSISHMDNVLSGTTTRAQALGALSEGYRLMGIKPKLILLDVDNRAYATKVDDYFAGHVTMKNPYESTNGSKMCLYMVQIPSA